MAPLEDALPPTPPSESTITLEIFQHLVSLAALELTEQESEYLRRELNQQLQVIRDRPGNRPTDYFSRSSVFG